jgi:PKD repeat protein
MHIKEEKKSKAGIIRISLSLSMLLTTLVVSGQVTADFSASDTTGCSPLTVQFTNEGSTGAGYSYKWYFGIAGTSTFENPLFTFFSPGNFQVKQVVTNTGTLEKDSVTKIISVTLTPSANLIIDSTNACVRGKVEFQAGFSSKDSARWDFGDGTSIQSPSSYVNHIYMANGTYPVTYITYYRECSDTSNYTVNVDGPIALITIDPEETCKNNPVNFTMTPVADVLSHSWNLNEGDIQNGNPVTHSYDTSGYISIFLTTSGLSGNCTIEDTVHVYEVVASFTFSDARCHQQRVFFTNTSIGNDLDFWNFGNGSTSTAENTSAIYNAGTYEVQLRVANDEGCADSITEIITISALPAIEISDNRVVCPFEPAILNASGGHIIAWSPPDAFDYPDSYNPTVVPQDTTTYYCIITDTLTQCSNTDSLVLYTQGTFIAGMISVLPTDTSLIIGDTVMISIFDTLGRDLSYTWTPETWISCADCNNPVFQPLETTTYTLVISDTNQCFNSESFEVSIEIREEYRIGLPEAFTPNNGDEINKIIKVNGWGIKTLIEFRIFNR